MTITEHVTVFISIIVGIAVGDLLLSFHKLLRARKLVKWHWLPLAVALFMLLLTVNYWWLAFGLFDDAQRLTVALFLPTLAQFVLLFLLVAASLPDEVPAEGMDLKAWYFDNARVYWTLASLSLLLDIVIDGARGIGPGGGLADIVRVKFNSVVMLPFLLAMILVRRSWYHAAFILVSLSNIAWVTITLALEN